MSSNDLPSNIKAVRCNPDGSRPLVEEIPFGTRQEVQNLDPEKIILSTRAIALNPTDALHAYSGWAAGHKNVVSTDAMGVAVRVGANVRHIQVGDRVGSMVLGNTHEDNGAAAEAVVVDAGSAYPLPQGMSDLEGAAFTSAHMTAVQTLFFKWKLPKPSSPSTASAKQTILIWGGSTGVGHHAVQLAHLSGQRVFVTASPNNHERMRELGADQVFDYRDPNVVAAIKEAAGEPGITFAYDTAGYNVKDCIDAIGSQGGRVMSTTPPAEELYNRREDVTLEFVIVYTILGYPFKFAGKHDFPAIPEDRAAALDWVTKELPPLIDGWVEGVGSSKFKGQSLRLMEGGLDDVYKGLDVLHKGDYKAEKLVYKLA